MKRRGKVSGGAASASSADAHPAGSRRRSWLSLLGLVLLLGLTAGRTMLGEASFRRGPLVEAGAFADQPVSEQMILLGEWARVLFGLAVVVLAMVGAVVLSMSRRRQVRCGVFAVWTALLGVCLLASATGASDKREALTAGLEQFSLLLSAFLAMQWASTPRRRALVLVVLASLAAVQGVQGLTEIFVDIPANVEQFETDPTAVLTGVGVEPGTPGAEMFETRLRERTAKGWFGLANPFGSMMVLLTLAGGGLAVARWRSARHRREDAPHPPETRKPGDIPLPLLAGILCTILLLPAAATWWLTDSLGAILAGILATGAAIVICTARSRAGRHRTALLLATAVFAVGATAGVVGWGLTHNGLPMRTLDVRWDYWTGSLRMLKDRPILGVGPGNFASAYLAVRPAGAEEAVRNPHNVVMHALAEYGLAGGFVYLALLAFVLIRVTAPQRPDPAALYADGAGARWPERGNWMGAGVILAAIVAGVWRLAVMRYPSAFVGLFDNLLPVAGFALAGWAMAWTGRPRGAATDALPTCAVVFWAAGLWGFALHNLSDFALFQPGAAMVFWTSAGALTAGAAPRLRSISRPTAIAAIAVLALVSFGGATWLAAPVWARTNLVLQAAESISRGRPTAGAEHLKNATFADPLEPRTPADLSRLLTSQARSEQGGTQQQTLKQARHYAELASDRDPARPALLRQLLESLAAELDPNVLLTSSQTTPTDVEWGRLQALAEREPNDARLQKLAGSIARRRGEHTLAERCWRRAIEAGGEPEPFLWSLLGDAQAAQGRTEEAVTNWLRFLAGRQEQAGQWSLLANGMEQLAAMDPQSLRLQLDLAELAWQGGRPDLTLNYLESAQQAEAALWPDSVQRFTAGEREKIETLRKKAELVRSVATPSRMRDGL